MSNQKPLVKTFENESFTVSLAVSATSAIICMQVISHIGFTHNTSIISGAVMAMTVASFPFRGMQKFRFLNWQNIVRTRVSGTGLAVTGNQYRFAKAPMSVSL